MKFEIIRAANDSCLFVLANRKLVRIFCPYSVVKKTNGERMIIVRILNERNEITFITEEGEKIKHSDCELLI